METQELFNKAKQLDSELLSYRSLYRKQKNKYDSHLKKLRREVKSKENEFYNSLKEWFKEINPKDGQSNINHQNDMLKMFENVLRKELPKELLDLI